MTLTIYQPITLKDAATGVFIGCFCGCVSVWSVWWCVLSVKCVLSVLFVVFSVCVVVCVCLSFFCMCGCLSMCVSVYFLFCLSVCLLFSLCGVSSVFLKPAK